MTDFVLSVEIIMIALGTVTDEPLATQIMVVSIIAIVATIGVYGIVALMVRMDDSGYFLVKKARKRKQPLKSIYVMVGKGLVWTLPKLIQLLAIVGTIAMLLVGGGMFVHNIHQVHEFFHAIPVLITELLMGLIVGLVAYLIVKAFKKAKAHFS